MFSSFLRVRTMQKFDANQQTKGVICLTIIFLS